jgi:hypothetical protein
VNTWIQTIAGNLVSGASVTHITMKETDSGVFTVGLTAGGAPATITRGSSIEAATAVRNRLAVALSAMHETPTLISVDEELAIHADAM